VGTTAFFAVKYADGVVTEGHYEKGIDYDKDKKLLKTLDYSIKILKIEKNNDIIKLKYKLNLNKKDLIDKINIMILRPAAKNDITNLKIKRIDNIYEVSFKALNGGHFLIRNSFNYDNLSIVYDKNFYVN
jgi:hypothetical protein